MSETTVYVVDDDAAIRHSMRRLVESIGLAVEAFASAREFLARFDPAVPGCVVLDVRMPEMSGLELQEELLARGHRVPIIVVTGYADVPMAVRSMRAGAMDFIEKPFTPQTLLERIQRAVAKDAEARRTRAEQIDVERRIQRLTPRELQVMDRVVAGRTSKNIAADLGLSPKTIHVHRAEMMAKMQAGSVAELTRMVVTARVQAEIVGSRAD
ncbi:MAG: response regulator transcription factor [Phycisphaerales bacterium]|nr:response regulator [Phycisphaerae bacterium]NNM27676.1 response regulator transcription factor [Phycisphaerales bacterium]